MTAAGAYQRGELLDVRLVGATVRDVVAAGELALLRVEVPLPDGTPFVCRVPLFNGNVEITRVAPVEYPPQIGDTWVARGGRWFAIAGRAMPRCDERDEAWMIRAADGIGMWASEWLALHGPVVLHNRDTTDLAPAVGEVAGPSRVGPATDPIRLPGARRGFGSPDPGTP